MPVSLAEALNKKYNTIDETDESDNMGNSTVGNCNQFVIFAPRARLHQCVPHTLIVSSSEVNRAGDFSTLQNFLKNANELDISTNELFDFNEIVTILQAAPKLNTFNISFNDLSKTEICSNICFPNLECIRSLILVGTKAKWNLIWLFLSHAQNCTDLHLSLNDYDKIDLDEIIVDKKGGNRDESHVIEHVKKFEKVDRIFLDENVGLKSWKEISKLGWVFPNLQFLSLTSCPLKIIPTDAHVSFSSLHTLWMSNCLIEELDNVERFRHFPCLANLRLNGIPFLEKFSEEKRRQHIIALLPNIKTLNRGREITVEDRETAERNFIRHYQHEQNPPSRFNELRQKHGEVKDFAKVNLKPPKTIRLLIMQNEKHLARMEIDLKLSVKELKELLEPVSGIQATKMKLYYYDVGGEWKDIMKYPDKKLFSYNMQDDDQIIIDN